MNIKITPNPLFGHVHVIGSKSYAHRALIAASLAHGKSTVRNYPSSDDVTATKSALKNFGISFDGDHIEGHIWIYQHTPIDCKASGSTLRFLIPLALLVKQEVIFTGVKRLFERPLDVYESIFDKSQFYKTHQGVSTKGPIYQRVFKVDGSKSSQFLTGLLFTLPLLPYDSTIEIMSSLQSESYVEITLDILRQSNIVIKRQDDIFNIQGNQTYQPISYEVEGDYSQAAFFMVAGTIGQRITLSNLTLNSLQGDRKVISIINQMGGHIEFDDKKNQFTVHPSQTIGIEIDLNDIPDLGPILMVLASLSKGKTTFKNVERLRYKESDRLSVMMEILTQNGIKIELNNEILIIEGKNSFIGGMAHQTHGDHRIAMALAIMSIRCESSIIIEHAEVVSKSYPDFFEVFKMLGGKYE